MINHQNWNPKLNRSQNSRRYKQENPQNKEYDFYEKSRSRKRKLNATPDSRTGNNNSRRILNMMLKKVMKRRGVKSTKSRQTPKSKTGSRGFFKKANASMSVEPRRPNGNRKRRSRSYVGQSPMGEMRDFKIREMSYDKRNSTKIKSSKYNDKILALYKNKHLKVRNLKLKNKPGIYGDQRES